MKRLWWKIVLSLFYISLLFPPQTVADSTCPGDDPCKNKESIFDRVSCYTNIVNICATQRESMAAQVTYLSSRIQLTLSKIESAKEKIISLEKEITELTDKIDNLENSLTKITGLFIDRIVATYKYGETSYLTVILSTNKFSDFINRYKYIQAIQTHDRRLLFQLQNSKVNFQEQKNLREVKKQELSALKKQLEVQQATLAIQKKEKEIFLEITRNSETKYRQELQAAKKESSEIQKAASILSSAGVAKKVQRGDVIGVMGNTGFSTGAHLHLSVYNLNETDLDKFSFNTGYENPVNFLVSRNLVFEPNSCDDVGNRQTKSVGGGSWEWPMMSPIISQCFGHTPWSWRYQTGIHNGIDMFDDGNPLIRAVEGGNAYTYRGGQSAGNGVFIFHPGGKMTLYWHLQ